MGIFRQMPLPQGTLYRPRWLWCAASTRTSNAGHGKGKREKNERKIKEKKRKAHEKGKDGVKCRPAKWPAGSAQCIPPDSELFAHRGYRWDVWAYWKKNVGKREMQHGLMGIVSPCDRVDKLVCKLILKSIFIRSIFIRYFYFLNKHSIILIVKLYSYYQNLCFRYSIVGRYHYLHPWLPLFSVYC